MLLDAVACLAGNGESRTSPLESRKSNTTYRLFLFEGICTIAFSAVVWFGLPDCEYLMIQLARRNLLMLTTRQSQSRLNG